MSTKIYTGFKVEGPVDQALIRLGALREQLQALVDKKSAHVLAERLAHFADQQWLGKAPLNLDVDGEDVLKSQSIWSFVSRQLSEDQRNCRASFTRDPMADCDLSLFLFFHASSGDLLGYLQEERLGAHAFLTAQSGIADFGYWNNSDPPDGITEEGWGLRGKQWDEVVDDPAVPKFSMTWEPEFQTWETIKKLLPTLEQRALRRAKDILFTEVYAARESAQKDKSSSTQGFVAAATNLAEALKSESSPEHARLQELAQEQAKLLPSNLAGYILANAKAREELALFI